MAQAGRLGLAIDGTTQGVVVTKSILRDVAAVAGVSLRTASRVLNDDPRVAVDTRARVQQAMRDLKYTPDSAEMQQLLRSGAADAVSFWNSLARLEYFGGNTDAALEPPFRIEEVAPQLLGIIGHAPVLAARGVFG